MKVLKFGGTSMANSESIKKVADIVTADKSAKVIVVSAPGKREKSDVKVTDMLYECFSIRRQRDDCSEAFGLIRDRFTAICEGLGLSAGLLDEELRTVKNNLDSGADEAYAASRGEYLSALVFAALTGFEFIDAAEIIRFDDNGRFDSEKTNELCKKRLYGRERGAVVPGFYGAGPDGRIITFSRGGSDVTGAILARAAKATVYENWTDVDGFMNCDPRIVKDPKRIEMITYKELRELSYMGANVLHPDSIFPVRKSDIPIRIKNTFNPQAPGTVIVPTKKYLKGEYQRREVTITGIAGKKDFVAIHIEKSMMNNERGFARRVLSVLEKYDVSLEHMPSGIDTLTIIFDGKSVTPATLNLIVEDIKLELKPDKVEVVACLALIAVVGHGMASKKGTATRVCSGLYRAGVNIRMIDQGSSEMNIIIAVENDDFEKAITSLFEEFKGEC